MKEKKFSVNHSEHVKALDSLTDPLKDQVKQGLSLIEGCVNQLAQAKWIFEEIQKTIKMMYNDCPSCASDLNSGSRRFDSKEAKKERESPPVTTGKKTRSVLPMVSGYAVQRPKIKITRVDSERSSINNKPSKIDESPTKKRGRDRSSSSSSRSRSRASRKEKNIPSKIEKPSPKKFSGPKSKNSDNCPILTPSKIELSLVKPCSVKLLDISSMLTGKTRFSGKELTRFQNGNINEGKSDYNLSLKFEKREQESRTRSRESSPNSEIKIKKRSYSSSPSPEPTLNPNDLFAGSKRKLDGEGSEPEPVAVKKPVTTKSFTSLLGNSTLKAKLKDSFAKFKQTKLGSSEPTSVPSTIAKAGLDIDIGIGTNGVPKSQEVDDGEEIAIKLDFNFDKDSDEEDDPLVPTAVSDRVDALNAIVLNEDSGPCFNET